ncbi:MAG TPA: aminotransferase class III-fold pyridoxal phosphate-dependent enzyme [Solirubrobacteraceae bacterium]
MTDTMPWAPKWTGFEASRGRFGRVVDGDGIHLILSDGRRMIDGTNTGAPLGHRHPDIVRAMRNAADNPIVHEGWDWVDRDEAVRDLAEIGFAEEPDWFGGVRFCLSGSEANDLALSLAQAITGRSKLATRERAYHGAVGLARDLTVQPQWHGGLSWSRGGVDAVPRTVSVVELPGPIGERIGPVAPDPERDAQQLAGAEAELSDAAAVILDYTQGAIYASPGHQDRIATAARNAGALFIADEVVTGLGRSGRWFGFQTGMTRPDIVTLGKGIGAGAAPAAAVVISRELAERIDGSTWQTAGTFRGHPIACAAIRAHLAVLARDGLVEHVARLDGVMERLLREVAAAHPSVQRIDGRGLHWSVELHGSDWRQWRADTTEEPLATRVAVRAADAGALILTSGEEGCLFLAPPLISEDQDLERLVAALDHGLELADEVIGSSSPPPD